MGDLAAFLLAGGRLVRRAIYTRQSVSSDDGLSSCQVQYQARESLVRSQRSVEWILLPERFDDEEREMIASPLLRSLLGLT